MNEKSRISGKLLSVLLALLMIVSSLSLVGLTAFAAENGDLLDTPVLVSVANTATGVKVSWEAVDGAGKYRIFVKTDTTEWNDIADTEHTSFTWTEAKSGTNYSFTVCCVNDDGSEVISDFDSEGLNITYISAPKLSSVANAATGVKITWSKVTGAVNYRVFYKANGEGTWHKAGDSTSTSYTWTKAVSDTEYVFTVRCIDDDGNYISSYDSIGLNLTYIAAPKLSSVANAATGVKITWGKVAGAEKYRVFYKANGEGTWHKAGDSTSASYTWTKAVSNTKYDFTVRCIDDDGNYISSYDPVGLSLKYIAAPKLSTVANAATGVKITWDKVTGAEKYRVFYKANGESTWHRAGNTTSTSYTWTGAKSGTKYTFTVRCTDKDGEEYISSYDPDGKTLNYIAAPKLSSAANAATGVKITWGKVTGAEKYRVFYKANGESTWHRAGNTTSTSYTWTGAKSGTNYTFTVRCTDKDGEEYISSYDPDGETLSYIAAPVISSVSWSSSGVQIKWGKVNGASKYRIFYKNGSGDWRRIADTSSTSYTWTGAKSGSTYALTVRCVSLDGSSYISSYDSTGKNVICYLVLNATANAAAQKYSSCTRYSYGTSAMGYPLEAFIINGNGKNNRIIFMDFAVHGFEDEYAKDGKVLVTLGNGLVEYYSAHPELLGNYRLVIVPCANPDGTMFGKNNYRADKAGAFGRCTYKGVDINRDFRSDGFKAAESIALRNLMNKYKPNVYLNFHGWENSVIGNPELVSIFRSKVELKTDKSNRYGSEYGYIISYTKSNYNAKSAIVEFKNASSVSKTKVINAINSVISNKL